mmetsp:Transcript_12490/g.17074  ORF Transcript_12490/g.17074 Transcript_12490/m.17074 type:complete len:159 (-) Transcript_12490:507-983(-)
MDSPLPYGGGHSCPEEQLSIPVHRGWPDSPPSFRNSAARSRASRCPFQSIPGSLLSVYVCHEGAATVEGGTAFDPTHPPRKEGRKDYYIAMDESIHSFLREESSFEWLVPGPGSCRGLAMNGTASLPLTYSGRRGLAEASYSQPIMIPWTDGRTENGH